MDRLDIAIIYAVEAHSGTTRKSKRTPFIMHPLEVVAIAGSLTDDKDVMAAAVLHDVIEDTSYSKNDLLSTFGDKVLKLVLSDTEDKMIDKSPSESWIERKQATLNYLTNSTKNEQIICLSDKLANLRELKRDYFTHGDSVWKKFNQQDKVKQAWYYKGIADRLTELKDTWAYKEYEELIKDIFD